MALKVRVALEASAAGIPEVVIAGKARLLGQFAGTRIVTAEESRWSGFRGICPFRKAPMKALWALRSK